MNNRVRSFIVALGSFVLMVISYEYKVYLWAQNEVGAIIRVDILVIYPTIILLSTLIYFIVLKIWK